jgi:hypothetical protein
MPRAGVPEQRWQDKSGRASVARALLPAKSNQEHNK